MYEFLERYVDVRWLMPGDGGADVPKRADILVPVRIAAGALTAFTAWSYLTVFWADDGGAAWESANRTLLYLVIFTLFALWRLQGGPGASVLGVWTLGIGVLATVTAVRLASGTAPHDLFYFDDRAVGRLSH